MGTNNFNQGDPTMNHNVIGAAHVITLQAGEAFLLMGDRSTQWPMVVRVLEWESGGTFVKLSGHRADRSGQAIEHQPTSECLMLETDSRLQHFPEWLREVLVIAGAFTPLENECICPDPTGGRHDSRCMIHGWAISTI